MSDSYIKYHLLAINGSDSEKFLGDYEDTFKAAEDAQYVFTEYENFRIVSNDNCILGTRIYEHIKDSKYEPGEVFWRIPRKIKTTRQRRVLDLIYAKLGINAD